MIPTRRFAVVVAVLALGVLITLNPKAGSPTAAAQNATEAPVQPTASVTPTPTPTVPPAYQLIAQANGSTEAKGSVQEAGLFHSSNQSLVSGFSYWAHFSWKDNIFSDRHVFSTPMYMRAAGGYITNIRRTAIGSRFGEQLDGSWTCLPATAQANSLLWSSPTFALSSPTVVSTTSLNGKQVWHVRGHWSHTYRGLRSELTVDVFLDTATGVYVESRESGWVTGRGERARVSSLINYSQYGRPVSAQLPGKCQPA